MEDLFFLAGRLKSIKTSLGATYEFYLEDERFHIADQEARNCHNNPGSMGFFDGGVLVSTPILGVALKGRAYTVRDSSYLYMTRGPGNWLRGRRQQSYDTRALRCSSGALEHDNQVNESARQVNRRTCDPASKVSDPVRLGNQTVTLGIETVRPSEATEPVKLVLTEPVRLVLNKMLFGGLTLCVGWSHERLADEHAGRLHYSFGLNVKWCGSCSDDFSLMGHQLMLNVD